MKRILAAITKRKNKILKYPLAFNSEVCYNSGIFSREKRDKDNKTKKGEKENGYDNR